MAFDRQRFRKNRQPAVSTISDRAICATTNARCMRSLLSCRKSGEIDCRMERHAGSRPQAIVAKVVSKMA
jgi:hypothetical protein